MDFIAIPALVLILYLVAEVIKFFWIKTDEQRTMLPTVCALLGAVLAAVLYIVEPSWIPADNLLVAICEGIVSGLASTGSNQFYKQLQKYIGSFNSKDTDDTTTTK